MPGFISRSEGRALFGRDPTRYDAARPDYPERVYQLLVEHCGLADGCRTLEVGAGSGRATRRLFELGARPLVAVEPDRGFGPALDVLVRDSHGAVVPCFAPFETAEVQEGTFDLAVGATSFHWLDRTVGPRKLGTCLRPGGWLALFWNVFGDPRQPDPFHDATVELLSPLAASPAESGGDSLPFALDVESRRADFAAAEADSDFRVEEIHWILSLTAGQVRALYATWSSICRLDDGARETLLDKIEAIADMGFGGVVDRRMVTPVYLGRRRS